jgi:hypothetical protein
MSSRRRAPLLLPLGLALALALAASGCGDPDPGVPDASAAIDAPSAGDAPLVVCRPDQLCFDYNPLDGVTDLPAGRLVVLWIPPETKGDSPAQVGYDGAWTSDVTAIDLASIAEPNVAFQTGFVPCGTPGNFGIALAVIGTNVDANTDGIITIEEFGAAEIYGIFQAGIVYSDVACAPTPKNPAGILTGVHVYSDAQELRDGVPTEMQTCSPGSAACANLDDPL